MSSYFLTIFLLISYCILTGREASILRATVMVCLYLFGTILKRESDLNYSLSWAAFFILLAKPLEIFDVGFQLSFISVFALGLWVKNRPPYVPNDPAIWAAIKSSFYISTVAWLSTLPLIAFYFFLVSPVTIFANLIAVPFFSGLVACGYSFLVLGSLSHKLAQILGSSVWFLTKFFLLISDFFSELPFAFFHLRPPGILEFTVFYSLFLLYFLHDRFSITLKRYALLSLFVFNIFIWKGVFQKPSSNLKVTFLDVGHGDSALIEFPKRGTLLVDGGLGGDWDQGRVTVAPFLWSKGITHLDGILVTHPHFDHYGGLKYILKEFSVGKVFDNGIRNDPSYRNIFSWGRKPIALKLGDKIQGIEDVQMQIYHPYPAFTERRMDPNDQSLVFQIQYGEFSLLLSGDAEQKALSSIVGLGTRLKSDVLKVPHHGSYIGKEGEEFFSLVSPKVAVISEAKRNRYRLPSAATVDSLRKRNIRIFQTCLSGAVECVSDGESFSIHSKIY